jgi:hypothetical protein
VSSSFPGMLAHWKRLSPEASAMVKLQLRACTHMHNKTIALG